MLMNRRRHHAFINRRKKLAAEHTAPAFEDVGSRLGRTHGKCHWRGEYQYAQQHIPLCRLKQQFQVVPRQDQRQDQYDKCHSSVGDYADDDSQYGVETCKIQAGKGGGQDPVVRGAANLEDSIDDLVRVPGKSDKQDRADTQFDRILCLGTQTQTEIPEEIPNP